MSQSKLDQAVIALVAKATAAFVQKWSPADRVPEFMNDLQMLSQAWMIGGEAHVLKSLGRSLDLDAPEPPQEPPPTKH